MRRWPILCPLILSMTLALPTVGPAAAFADEPPPPIVVPSHTDEELINALRVVATRDGGWSKEDWKDFGLKMAKYAAIAAGVAGAGAAIYYFIPNKGWMLTEKMSSPDAIKEAATWATTHANKGVFGAAVLYVTSNFGGRFLSLNSVTEAQRLRNASTPDARVYRSHLREFFRLSFSEQFLIARQDPVMTHHLFCLAQIITAENERLAQRRAEESQPHVDATYTGP